MNEKTRSIPLSFYLTPDHDCPYLPKQQSKTAFLSPEIASDSKIYSVLIDQGFRRSGEHIYKPHCDQCKACISVRLPVKKFQPNKNQKRCYKKINQFQVSTEPARFNQKHFELFEKYITARHKNGDMYPTSIKQYKEFLLCQWLDCNYLNFIDIKTQKLVATCVYDNLDLGLSAVYTFFDPDYAKYGLGKMAVLQLIEQTKQLGLDYVYLGYWIKESPKMSYKGDYRPLECFVNGQWIYLS